MSRPLNLSWLIRIRIIHIQEDNDAFKRGQRLAGKMCMRNLGKLVIMFSCQGLLDNSDLRNRETDG